jgi:hypothetical protein
MDGKYSPSFINRHVIHETGIALDATPAENIHLSEQGFSHITIASNVPFCLHPS